MKITDIINKPYDAYLAWMVKDLFDKCELCGMANVKLERIDLYRYICKNCSKKPEFGEVQREGKRSKATKKQLSTTINRIKGYKSQGSGGAPRNH